LQLDNSSPDPLPDRLAIEITMFEYLVRMFRSLDLRFGSVPLNKQVRGAPNVDVCDHGLVC
jgi:hypothetical protein